MSEQQHKLEAHEHLQLRDHVEHAGSPETNTEVNPEDYKHGQQEDLEQHRTKVEQHSVSGAELSHVENEQPTQHSHPLNASQHKSIAWNRSMTRTRKKLNPIDRTFSKIAHSSVVDAPSEFIGKTVARPLSMFWGSLFAFIGTSALLWITNHYGYQFNYLFVMMTFFIGAVIGLAIEGSWRLVKKT